MRLPRFIRLRCQGLAYRLSLAGIDADKVWRSIRTYPGFLAERRRFAALLRKSGAPLPLGMDCWCLHDRDAPSGVTRSHYFNQDLLIARRIFAAQPKRHLDVGSRVDGFVAHVASYRAIEVIDIRPPDEAVPGISFLQADLMKQLPEHLHACTDSLSCLHALEHFGLGRYGDELDPEGHVRGLRNLQEMLAPGGRLYLSVPMGPARIEFNAHRVFDLPGLLALLVDGFAVERCAYVDDAGRLHDDVAWTSDEAQRSFGCAYGCVIIEALRRP